MLPEPPTRLSCPGRRVKAATLFQFQAGDYLAARGLGHGQGLVPPLASPQDVRVQCPVCRETLVYDLSALKAAPPPQHPLVRDGGSPAQLRQLAGSLQLGQQNG